MFIFTSCLQQYIYLLLKHQLVVSNYRHFAGLTLSFSVLTVISFVVEALLKHGQRG